MHREKLPIAALHSWGRLNSISFLDVAVRDLGQQGHGIVIERNLASTEGIFDIPALMIVPNELVLCKDFIEEHAKVDHHFKELLEVAGGSTLRIDLMLFLLVQVTITSKDSQAILVSNVWTEYVKMLPDCISVPTVWTEEEVLMLQGTSLEKALQAKIASLEREFEAIRDATATISWCQTYWWEQGSFQLADWLLIDAWFRSRTLEHPTIGQCMIPGLDMVNHASQPNSLYEMGAAGAIQLLLRPNLKLEGGTEVTISYGDAKDAAEMLFSYGFVEREVARRSMVLHIEPDPSDPLGKAKSAVFKGSKSIQLLIEDGHARWRSPYLFLLCVNQEDGLDFKILQETNGTTSSLRMFWKDTDVTEATDEFEISIKKNNDQLCQVFELRAVAMLEERLKYQLSRLYNANELLTDLAETVDLAVERQEMAIHLRNEEEDIMLQTLEEVRSQKAMLLQHENVRQYLGLSDDATSATGPSEEVTSSNEDDFS